MRSASSFSTHEARAQVQDHWPAFPDGRRACGGQQTPQMADSRLKAMRDDALGKPRASMQFPSQLDCAGCAASMQLT